MIRKAKLILTVDIDMNSEYAKYYDIGPDDLQWAEKMAEFATKQLMDGESDPAEYISMSEWTAKIELLPEGTKDE